MIPLKEEDLNTAISLWGDGLVAIANAFDRKGFETARSTASKMLDDLYAFEDGSVLFKPTMASGEQTFRPTKDGALAYFVGHSDEYPLDGGFGIKGWRKVVSETSECFIDGNIAMWKGWVTFTDKNGSITKVDKSWGYKKDDDGVLRIVLHHSSLPYSP